MRFLLYIGIRSGSARIKCWYISLLVYEAPLLASHLCNEGSGCDQEIVSIVHVDVCIDCWQTKFEKQHIGRELITSKMFQNMYWVKLGICIPHSMQSVGDNSG